VAADFVARLGSRATAPGEVRSDWGLEEYVGLTARAAGVADELHRLAHHDARALRRLDPDRLLALLAALARPPSAELNKARLAAAAGIPATTISPYVDVLVDLGLVRLLPGCRASVAKRAIGRPRAIFTDPAVARHLAGVTMDQLTDLRGRSSLAPLLTGVVAEELSRQRETSAVDYRLSHLRERNGLEIDLVVELPDDTVYGLEVRTAASLRPHQFSGLAALAARAGWRFRGGVVLNTASVGHEYRPGLWGLPISSLWDWDAAANLR
jgi:predicted AAA+ superfamily ATPase